MRVDEGINISSNMAPSLQILWWRKMLVSCRKEQKTFETAFAIHAKKLSLNGMSIFASREMNSAR